MDLSPETKAANFVSKIQGWLLPDSHEKDQDQSGIDQRQRKSPNSVLRKDNASGSPSPKTLLSSAGTPEKQNSGNVPPPLILTSTLSDSRIDDVLHFWFSGDMQFNYKTKWFPDGSAETQRKADETVFNLFGNLFLSAINDELQDWKKEIRSTVALIIVLDQFSRHIYRLQLVRLFYFFFTTVF